MTYLAHYYGEGGVYPVQTSYNFHAHLRRSLDFQYGPEQADTIIAGLDPATNADIAKWNNLGIRGGQAA